MTLNRLDFPNVEYLENFCFSLDYNQNFTDGGLLYHLGHHDNLFKKLEALHSQKSQEIMFRKI